MVVKTSRAVMPWFRDFAGQLQQRDRTKRDPERAEFWK